MTKLTELAEELLPKCPKCGVEGNENHFMIRFAQIKEGLFNKKKFLHITYNCGCLRNNSIATYNIESPKIGEYLEEERIRQKRIEKESKW